MGNAPSHTNARKKRAVWSIPLNRAGLPVLAAPKHRRHHRPVYRRPSLRTWDENNNNRPPTWADVRRYLVHGPL